MLIHARPSTFSASRGTVCDDTNIHLLLSNSISFTSTKACIVNSNNVFYSYIHTHTVLSYTHSFMSLFLPKLLILYTVSTQQWAWNKVWYFKPVLHNSTLPLNYSTPNEDKLNLMCENRALFCNTRPKLKEVSYGRTLQHNSRQAF